MIDNDIKRIPRLTAILTQLQSKKIVTATALAKKFEVSVRTIYRDIKALEQAGVPVLTEEGKGYSLMEGYRLPPIMFTESEATALLTAEKIVLKSKDTSFIKEFTEAINKIKAVMSHANKEKSELLSKRVVVGKNMTNSKTSRHLSEIQRALVNFKTVQVDYLSGQNEMTIRVIEPFALYNDETDSWTLIAFCRLRNDFRSFRLDRMVKIQVQSEQFEPHKITVEQWREKYLKPYYNTPDTPLS